MFLQEEVYHTNVTFYLRRDCIRMKTYWCGDGISFIRLCGSK